MALKATISFCHALLTYLYFYFGGPSAQKCFKVSEIDNPASNLDLIGLFFKHCKNSCLQHSCPHNVSHCRLISFRLQDFSQMSFTVSGSWLSVSHPVWLQDTTAEALCLFLSKQTVYKDYTQTCFFFLLKIAIFVIMIIVKCLLWIPLTHLELKKKMEAKVKIMV